LCFFIKKIRKDEVLFCFKKKKKKKGGGGGGGGVDVTNNIF